jgi:hypothetical protein
MMRSWSCESTTPSLLCVLRVMGRDWGGSFGRCRAVLLCCVGFRALRAVLAVLVVMYDPDSELYANAMVRSSLPLGVDVEGGSRHYFVHQDIKRTCHMLMGDLAVWRGACWGGLCLTVRVWHVCVAVMCGSRQPLSSRRQRESSGTGQREADGRQGVRRRRGVATHPHRGPRSRPGREQEDQFYT